MKRKLAVLFLSLLFSLNLGVQEAHAQQLGILPKVPAGVDCDQFFKQTEVRNAMSDLESFKRYNAGDSAKRDQVLACAVKTGRSHLFMLPFYIMYMIEFLLGIAGLLAVLFICYGGFKYVTGGISNDKETGKKVIFQSLLGLVVTLGAWIIVNLLQSFLTS